MDAALDLIGRENIDWECPHCKSTSLPFQLTKYYVFELCMKISKSLPCPVKVSKSVQYGGSGVFAEKDIAKHSVITYYPPHAVMIDMLDGTTRMIDQLQSYGYLPPDEIHNMIDNYTMSCCMIKFVGDPKIGLGTNPQNPSFVGHLINDSIDVDTLMPLALLLFNSKSDKDLLDFNTALNGFSQNAIFLSCLDKSIPAFPIYAARDIKKGEEITHAYGTTFWLKWLLVKSGVVNRDDAIAFTIVMTRRLWDLIGNQYI